MNKILKNIGLITWFIFGSLSVVTCQLSNNNTWNLEKCIDYAISNNLDLKATNLSLSQSLINKKQSIYSYLPTLSAGATHGYNWGQSIDPFTNQFANSQVRSNNMYVNSEIILFSGLRNYYTNKKTNSEYLTELQSKKIQQRDLKISVSALFLQTLLNLKTIEITKKQISYSISQTKQIKELIKQKHKTMYDLLDVQSQLGLDSLAFIKAQNEYKLTVLKLKQFLNLKLDTIFKIDESYQIDKNIAIPEINYSKFNEILLVKEELVTQVNNIKIAKSGFYPTLTLSTSLGSGYSGNLTELVGTENLPKSFNIQAKENFYQTVTLSLNIPIFNGNKVNSQIKLAKIEFEKIKVQKEKKILEIENKIKQLKIEIENIKTQIKVTEKVSYSLNQNFNATSLKYKEGVVNYAQFLDSKNKMFKTEVELLQIKIQYVFKLKILEFYNY